MSMTGTSHHFFLPESQIERKAAGEKQGVEEGKGKQQLAGAASLGFTGRAVSSL
jgi:hypothetical protein